MALFQIRRILSGGILLLVTGLYLLVGTSVLRAQEVDASVSVNVDQLSPLDREEVLGFGEEMQKYINNTRWTDLEWQEPKVKMNFSVVFTGGSGGYYSAKMIVGSQRTLRKSGALAALMKVLDDDWSFRYVRNEPFQQDPTSYDELSSLIDFYVYLALGLDQDSRTYLGGTKMYERANEIAQRAQVRSDSKGWTTQAPTGSYSRYGFARELTSLRHAPIRKFIYNYHFNGLDNLADNRAAALDSVNNYLTDLVRAMDKLVEPSTIVRVLNDAKNLEYAELFTGYRDDLLWRKLLYIDPIHQSVYETAKNR